MKALIQPIAVFALLFNLAALPINGADIDDLTWEINEGNTVRITDCNELATGELIIPDVIERRIVTSIGNDAFRSCTNLTRITIPDGVNHIGNDAFRACFSLTGITISEGITSIENGTFAACTKLTSITIPDGVTSIGESAFQQCYELASITIPDGVTSIGASAFSNCRSLTNITLPDGITSIEYGAFSLCRSLTIITIPDGVTSIGAVAFSGCSDLMSITIPENVTSIAQGAFRDCTSLRSITIPEGVTKISAYTFSGCSGLTSITMPEGVTIIGDQAFRDCVVLREITIPADVASIGSVAFKDCTGLSEVTFLGDKPSFGQHVFDGVDAVVMYPSFATGYSNPLSGLMAYKDGDYDPVNHHHQKAQLEILKQIRDNGRDAQQNTQLEVLKQIRDQLQSLNTKMLDLQASVAEKDAQIAQLQARPTLEEVQEGREGSVVLEVDPEGGTVTLGLTIEQSGDLIDWTPIDGELTRTIPIPDGKKFYRFALDKGKNPGQG